MQVFSETHYRAANRGGQAAFRSRLRRFKSRLKRSGLSIKFTLQGQENYSIQQQEIALQPGSYLVVNQGKKMACAFSAPQPVEGICLYLEEQTVFQGFLRHSELITCHHPWWANEDLVLTSLLPITDDDLSQTIQNITQTPDSYFNKEDAFCKITTALVKQQISLRNDLARIPASQLSTKLELVKRIRSVDYYMRNHPERISRLEDLAKRAHLSKYHFARLYQTIVENSPKNQLNKYRIQKAKWMLSKSQKIVDVALSCGFNDRQTFARAFASETGITPSVFQQQLG